MSWVDSFKNVFIHFWASQALVFGSEWFDWSLVPLGPPQGLYFRSLLYILYIADLNLVLSSLQVAAHRFADTQACVDGPAVQATS